MSITLENVSYIYEPDMPSPVRAVDAVSLELPENQFIGIIGHTGSGKSTLIQLFNGLMKPTSGTVRYNGRDVWEKDYPIRELRFHVGLVFQYPEHQLFEETVFRDICFGPRNQGLPEEEVEKRARKAMAMTGLSPDLENRSPFELSGGQKRRTAIAGVLAMNPDFLVLDEPTAGLDPQGRDEILEQVSSLRKESGITVILVSHSMEDVARFADRLIVVDAGRIRFDASPREVFSRHRDALEAMGLAVPQITDLAARLRKSGFPVPADLITVGEAKEAILRVLKGGRDQ